MDGIYPIQSAAVVNKARLQPVDPVQPVDKTVAPDISEAGRPRLEETTVSPPPVPPESLEGRDLADPFEARRQQERPEGSAAEATPSLRALEIPELSPQGSTEMESQLSDTERLSEPEQSASRPRAIARYQDVPRTRADLMTSSGRMEVEPEPLALDTAEGGVEDLEASGRNRETLEQTNEERIRRGSADIASGALSGAGEQVAAVIDDRSLRAKPPEVTEALDETPEDAVDLLEFSDLNEDGSLAPPEAAAARSRSGQDTVSGL